MSSRTATPYKGKVVLVGKSCTGKTSLCCTYLTNDFPRAYNPRVFSTGTKPLMIANHVISLEIVDTSNNDNTSNGKYEHYDRERKEICRDPTVNIFLLCFSVIYDPEYHGDGLKSREEEIMNGKEELQSLNSSVPIILCGTKIDTRNKPTEDKGRWTHYGNNQSWNDTAQLDAKFGKRMAKQIGAIDYVECSSLEFVGVENVFRTVTMEALKNMGVVNDQNSSGCCVLL